MITNNSKIAIILPTGDEAALFSGAIGTLGFKNITIFTDSRLAFEAALKTQFDLFILRIEMPDISGPTFIQKIRETGNYGLEYHFLVGSAVNPILINIFSEYEIKYVLVKPFNFDRITEKMKYLILRENNLSEFETRIREIRSALAGGQTEMATDLAVKIQADPASQERICILRGDIELKKKDYLAARKWFELARQGNSQNITALHRIAHTHVLAQEFDLADVILETIKDASALNLRVLLDGGLTSLKLGRFAEAARLMLKAKELDNEHSEANQTLSMAYIQNKDLASLKYVLAAIKQPENLLEALNSEGKNLFAQGKKIEALDVFKLCIQEIGDRANTFGIHFNIAQVYINLGHLAEARSHLASCLQLNPQMIDASKNLAKVEEKMKRGAAA